MKMPLHFDFSTEPCKNVEWFDGKIILTLESVTLTLAPDVLNKVCELKTPGQGDGPCTCLSLLRAMPREVQRSIMVCHAGHIEGCPSHCPGCAIDTDEPSHTELPGARELRFLLDHPDALRDAIKEDPELGRALLKKLGE